MTLDLAKLRALAEAATPGPWKHYHGEVVQLTDAGKGYPLDYYQDSADVVGIDGDGDLRMSDPDGDFIAAANPKTVLSLIDECESASMAGQFMETQRDQMRAERDAARADLARVRRLAEEACELASEGYSRGWDGLDQRDAETRIAAIREGIGK